MPLFGAAPPGAVGPQSGTSGSNVGSAQVNPPMSINQSGGGFMPSWMSQPTGSMATGAGQGPVPSTGQLGVNPFNNVFNFQIPTANQSQDSGAQTVPAPGGNSGGYGQYVPLIIVGVVVAGIAYYAFERKGK